MTELDAISHATRRRVRGYFEKKPKWPSYFLGLGIALGLGAALSGHVWSLGTASFSICACWLYLFFRPVGIAKKAEVDAVAASDFAAAAGYALEAGQLGAQDLRRIEACSFRSANSAPDVGAVFKGVKRGKDLKTRWTPHEISVVHFGHEQLFVYRCVVDLTTGNCVYEQTNELLYREVLSVEMTTEAFTKQLHDVHDRELRRYWERRLVPIVNDVLQVTGHRSLRLRLRSGADLELAHWNAVSGGVVADEEALNAPAAAQLRHWLREAKQAGSRLSLPPRIVRHTRPQA